MLEDGRGTMRLSDAERRAEDTSVSELLVHQASSCALQVSATQPVRPRWELPARGDGAAPPLPHRDVRVPAPAEPAAHLSANRIHELSPRRVRPHPTQPNAVRLVPSTVTLARAATPSR